MFQLVFDYLLVAAVYAVYSYAKAGDGNKKAAAVAGLKWPVDLFVWAKAKFAKAPAATEPAPAPVSTDPAPTDTTTPPPAA